MLDLTATGIILISGKTAVPGKTYKNTKAISWKI